VRYRTAAILSISLIGGMFGLPAAVKAAFLPSLRQGLPNPVPGWEQMLLSAAIFCLEWRWLLVPPVVILVFAFAGISNPSDTRKRGRTHSVPGLAGTRR
jgi:hypothetical protein